MSQNQFLWYEVMAGITKEYIRSIIPKDLPDGRKLLQEGIEMGKKIQCPVPRWYKAHGYQDRVDYENKRIASGEITFAMNFGFPTIEETVTKAEEITKWAEENKIRLIALPIPSINLAIPKELRGDEGDGTSFMMETLEDYQAFDSEIALMDQQGNQMLVVPNALETVENCLKSGVFAIGTTCQLAWNFPGCNDHVSYVADTIRGIGMMLAHKEKGTMTTCYIEDGLGGCCIDAVSYIAYYLFEKHIYEEVCGLRLSNGFGALLTDLYTKAALMKALNDLAKSENNVINSGLGGVHASTTSQWDHDVEANYGSSLQELLMIVAAEKHYKTGGFIITVPVTEAIEVPKLEELKAIVIAAHRLTETADQWEQIIDWTEIDRRAEVLKQEGTKMYHNILDTLKDAGIDTEDPMQMLMFIKNVNGALFEEAFHPTVREEGIFKPYFPNDMGRLTMDEVHEALDQLKAAGYEEDCLKNKKILVGSLDTHAYGVRFAKAVLASHGASVEETGVDNTIQMMFDTADEEGIDIIGVSTHNGKALPLAQQMVKEMEKRGKKYTLFMGGTLNTILPGHSVPSDVTEAVAKTGVIPANDMEAVFKVLAR